MLGKNNMIENIINEQEIQKYRSPDEFVRWFESCLRRINRVKDYRKQILLREGIAKQLFEEVFPLYRLLSRRKRRWREKRFINIIGSQSYDVRVLTSSHSFLNYIEIIVADNDHDEALRMEYFEKEGDVYASGSVSHSGTKKTGHIISVENEARLHSEIVQEKMTKIKNAVTKKSRNSYPSGTGLLVYFDDYVTLFNPKDYIMIQNMLESLEQIWRRTFTRIFLVGASGRKILEIK